MPQALNREKQNTEPPAKLLAQVNDFRTEPVIVPLQCQGLSSGGSVVRVQLSGRN